jgi:hypothetical protein
MVPFLALIVFLNIQNATNTLRHDLFRTLIWKSSGVCR